MTLDRSIQAQLGAALLFLCASLFAFYRWHYEAQIKASAGLQTLSDMLRIESAATSVPKPVDGRTADATMPALLSGIQKIAGEHNVHIGSVAANPTDPEKITFGIHGDFRDVIGFLGALETFRLVVRGFDFVPDQKGVNGSIEIQHSQKPGAPASVAEYLDALMHYTAIRNPFEIGDPVPLANARPDLGDLSWNYHLTSISLDGAERVATIDGKDYRPGDRLGDLKISVIGPSSVSLMAPDNSLVQKLHFRRNPGGANHAE